MTVEITCPYCSFSKQMSTGKIPPGARWATCPRCKQRFEFDFQDPTVGIQAVSTGRRASSKRSSSPIEKRYTSPWERRSELGIWRGLYDSFKRVLLSPGNIFGTMTHKDGIKEPLAFGLLLGSLGAMFWFFWDFLMLGDSIMSRWPGLIGQFSLGFIFFIVMVLTPLFVLIGMFVVSSILHLSLLIIGGGRNGFEGTFRVVAFYQSTKLLEFVPFVCWFFGWFWHIVVQVIGLREMHETSYLRTIIAMILPIAVILILSMAILIPMFIFL